MVWEEPGRPGHHPDVSLRSSGHGGPSREHQHGPLTCDQLRGGRPGRPVPEAAEPSTAGGWARCLQSGDPPYCSEPPAGLQTRKIWAPEPAAWVYQRGPTSRQKGVSGSSSLLGLGSDSRVSPTPTPKKNLWIPRLIPEHLFFF